MRRVILFVIIPMVMFLSNAYAIDVVMTVKPIRQGELISHDDVRLSYVDASRSIGAFTNVKDVVGLTAKIHLPNHSILKPGLLRKTYLIQQGQMVNIELEGNGFSIEAEGVALKSGAVGDMISVKIKNKTIVSGFITSDGVVRIKS
jgi:flagella basal body P-ring formation protein FlgA